MSLRTYTPDTSNTTWRSPFAAATQANRSAATRTLLLAALLTIGLYFVPYAGYATYPIRLLGDPDSRR